jgi:hypothetical protein
VAGPRVICRRRRGGAASAVWMPSTVEFSRGGWRRRCRGGSRMREHRGTGRCRAGEVRRAHPWVDRNRVERRQRRPSRIPGGGVRIAGALSRATGPVRRRGCRRPGRRVARPWTGRPRRAAWAAAVRARCATTWRSP